MHTYIQKYGRSYRHAHTFKQKHSCAKTENRFFVRALSILNYMNMIS